MKFLLTYLAMFGACSFFAIVPFAFWGSSAPTGPLTYAQAVQAEPTAQHLWLFDNPSSTTIRDYVGSDNLTIPSGLTMGNAGLLLNQTNTSATTSGSARIICANTNSGNFNFTSNFTFEFIINPNLARSGSGVNYVLFAKPSTSVYYALICMFDWNDSASGTEANSMAPTLYLQDNSGSTYRFTAYVDITNGAPVMLDYVWDASATPPAQIWANGNLLYANEVKAGVLSGTIQSTNAGTLDAYNASGTGFFAGTNQAAAIFATNLSYSQILGHYMAFQGGAVSNTMLYPSMRGTDDLGRQLQTSCLYPFQTPSGWYCFAMQLTNDSVVGGQNDNKTTSTIVYYSPDLSAGSFHNLGIALDASALPNITSLTGVSVISNSATGSNVLWGKYASNNNGSFYAVVAASKTAAGPYAMVSPGILLNGNQPTDLHVYCEGTNAYCIYHGPTGIYITALDTNFYNSVGSATVVMNTGADYEAPSVCKIGQVYMANASSLHFYYVPQAYDIIYAWTTNLMMGPWSATNSLYLAGQNPWNHSGYVMQGRSIISNYDGTYLEVGDNWYNGGLSNSSTIWNALSIDATNVFHIPTTKAFKL